MRMTTEELETRVWAVIALSLVAILLLSVISIMEMSSTSMIGFSPFCLSGGQLSRCQLASPRSDVGCRSLI